MLVWPILADAKLGHAVRPASSNGLFTVSPSDSRPDGDEAPCTLGLEVVRVFDEGGNHADLEDYR